MKDFDTVVIGAGVVGLAVAREISRRGQSVIILERSDLIASETSSRNSGVIHAGIFGEPTTLKSTLCIRGRELLYEYCAAKDIAHRKTGKFMVANGDAEESSLRQLVAKTADLDIEFSLVDPVVVSELEPQVQCTLAAWSPQSGIVDPHELALQLLADAELAGAILAKRTEVTRIEASSDGIHVRCKDVGVHASQVINCAGLQAQAVARTVAEIDLASVPESHLAIGQYYLLAGKSPFRHLVYPVANDGGLGVHVTLDMAGQVRFGPDCRWLSELDYQFDDSLREQFIAAIRSYFPGIVQRRLQPGYTGIRPRLAGPGESPRDFMVSTEEQHGVSGLVNLYGIESPGLTACLALGEHVADAVDA